MEQEFEIYLNGDPVMRELSQYDLRAIGHAIETMLTWGNESKFNTLSNNDYIEILRSKSDD